MNETIRVFIRPENFETYKKHESVNCAFREGDYFYVELNVPVNYVEQVDSGWKVQQKLPHGLGWRE